MTGDRATLARWVEWAAADKMNRGLLATSTCTGPDCSATVVAS